MGPERILLRNEGRYIAHPHLAALADGSWLLVATCGPRRPVTLHPPLDPAFVNLLIRSDDEGATWSMPAPVPFAGADGAECSGLTALPDGGVLLDQWRFRWYGPDEVVPPGDAPLASAADLTAELDASPELDGRPAEGLVTWARGGGTLTIWRSDTGGRHWHDPVVPDLGAYPGGYGLRGGLVTGAGAVLLPLTDAPAYRRVFLLRSSDGGRSWEPPVAVAEDPSRAFEEPALVETGEGGLLVLLRDNASRSLFAARSEDGGATWSSPAPAGLAGFPAHLLRLPDGRLAAVTAVRDPPGAVLLALSPDGGGSWDPPVTVAGNLGTHDLGYPTLVSRRDGTLFVAYYRRDAAGVTGVYARTVHLAPSPH